MLVAIDHNRALVDEGRSIPLVPTLSSLHTAPTRGRANGNRDRLPRPHAAPARRPARPSKAGSSRICRHCGKSGPAHRYFRQSGRQRFHGHAEIPPRSKKYRLAVFLCASPVLDMHAATRRQFGELAAAERWRAVFHTRVPHGRCLSECAPTKAFVRWCAGSVDVSN